MSNTRPPGRCADDVWWVWCRLAKKFPEKETFDYSERQIRGAWREVLAERRHWDTVGGGPQGSPACKARRAALRRLAAESHRPLRELARLQMADYDPLSAEVRLSPASHGSIVLSRCGRKSMEFWLAIRGGAEGRLFEAPTKPAATAARGGSSAHELDECPDRHVVDGGRRLEEADLIERIAGEDDAAALIYLRENVTSQGDWPEGLLQSLDARSVALSPPTERSASQKKRQRRLGRVHCIERWRELSQ